jgi:hypothetical protein
VSNHTLIGAIANLWVPIAAGPAALLGNPFPCPSSAAFHIILGSSLRPLPLSSGPSPRPALRQAGDLAFDIEKKIEAFNLHPLLQQMEPPSALFNSPECNLGTVGTLPSYLLHPIRHSTFPLFLS